MTDVSTVLLAVADDQEWSGVRSVLADDFGYRVMATHTVKNALALIDDATINLAICETELGGENALGILRHCRVSSRAPCEYW